MYCLGLVEFKILMNSVVRLKTINQEKLTLFTIRQLNVNLRDFFTLLGRFTHPGVIP